MDQFYRRFFPNDGDALDGFHHAVEAHLPSSGRLLDLGCGDNRRLAPYRLPHREVWGTDFQEHPSLVDPSWFRPLLPDGGVPFSDNMFDLVTACWVAEHVRSAEAFLDEVTRLLRPGGRLILLTASARHYLTWVARAVGLLPHGVTRWLVHRLYGRPPHDTYPVYYRCNTPEQLARCGQKVGLELQTVDRFANPDYFSFSPHLRKGAILLDWLLEQKGAVHGRLYMVATLQKTSRGPRTISRTIPETTLAAA